MKNTGDGLGDKVEKIIKTVLPKIAEKKKYCKSCNQKKQWLNSFNANIWTRKK